MEEIEKRYFEKQVIREYVYYTYDRIEKSFKMRVGNCMICCRVIMDNEVEKFQLVRLFGQRSFNCWGINGS